MKYEYSVMPSSTSPCSTLTRTTTGGGGKRRFNANDPKYRCCCGRPGKCHVRTGAMFVGAGETIIVCLLMIAAGVWFVYDGYRTYPKTISSYGGGGGVPDSPQSRGEEYDSNRQPKFRWNYLSTIWLCASLAVGLFVLLTVACLFAGIVRERRCLLWPNMIALWLLIFIFAALLVYSIIYTIFAGEALLAVDEQRAAETEDAAQEREQYDDQSRYRAVKSLVLYCVQCAACFAALIVFFAFFRVVRRCYRYLRDADRYEKKWRYTNNTSAGTSPNATLNGARQKKTTIIIESGGLLSGGGGGTGTVVKRSSPALTQ